MAEQLCKEVCEILNIDFHLSLINFLLFRHHHSSERSINNQNYHAIVYEPFLKSMENKDGYCWRKTWNWLLFLCSMRTPHLFRNWY
jgi:hypothetical protein